MAEPMDASERKQLGAWYTPGDLVGEVVRRCVPRCAGRRVRALDPACGDGRFLVAAAEAITAAGGHPILVGIDVDASALTAARDALSRWPASLHHADARQMGPGSEAWAAPVWRTGPEATADAIPPFDLVVGNPPFLSQMAASTTRGGASSLGGGPYADVAVEFLALAAHLVAPEGGRIGFVLPQSLLASRDAAAVRRRVGAASVLRWLWWSAQSVFDARVRTCALVIETAGGSVAAPLEPQVPELSEGIGFTTRELPATLAAVLAQAWRDGAWAQLLARGLGVPALPDVVASSGTLGDRAGVHLDFRDEYYGLVGAVGDDLDGPPLVTSGLIDPGTCAWGRRPVRFAKTTHTAPRVALDRLAPPMRRWATQRLVPKVLVASQTRVVEAVADEVGAWLPGVPVVSVVPATAGGADVWPLAAVLTSPVASAWVAGGAAGAALSTTALRITPGALTSLPWPAGDLAGAVAALRRGDVPACGAAVCAAYGLDALDAGALTQWWEASLPRRTR